MANDLEDRVADLEHRLDQTAGRLQAALELLDVTTGAAFAATAPSFWSDTFERLSRHAPLDASQAYVDAFASVLAHCLLERFRPGDPRSGPAAPESVSLRLDALEGVFVELAYQLYRLQPGGAQLLRIHLRRCIEDVLPSSGVANIQFSDWVVRIVLRIEDKLDAAMG